jgi:hypothetical protein
MSRDFTAWEARPEPLSEMCLRAVTSLDIKSYRLETRGGWRSCKGGRFIDVAEMARRASQCMEAGTGVCVLSDHARVAVRQGCHLTLQSQTYVAACRRACLERTVPVACLSLTAPAIYSADLLRKNCRGTRLYIAERRQANNLSCVVNPGGLWVTSRGQVAARSARTGTTDRRATAR